jgi:preprotein translocase subunit SecA
MFKFLGKLFDSNEKEIIRLREQVDAINKLEGEVKLLTDSDITKKTLELKEEITSGKTTNDILPIAFALVREAAVRTIGLRHYDVQFMASIALHEGKVAEQKTGEGKTLAATPAMYLNALTGRGVHLVTVNDYLARRDAGWMGPVFHLLGIKVSAMINGQSFLYDPEYVDNNATDWRLKNLKPVSRKEAYDADIAYGINSEFGFDYLRDNMVSDASQMVQRGFHYAIVDEVDSVLIDEARTPHIISAPDTEPTSKYYDYAKIVDKLESESDYQIDEKLRTSHLTDKGIMKVEKMLGINNIYEKDFDTVHHLEAALKARTLFKKEKDYIVRDGEVIIVDEFTGRLLSGRRFSEGIHQAIEAKEGVTIQRESKTLATVSLQNYFRQYEKLSGMTGTAATEAEEFHKIYNMDVIIIPTNNPMIRIDHPDSVYKTTRAKYGAIANEVADCYKRGQPVLVGTTSIDKNEILSKLLEHKGIPHKVLNAKNHTNEAMIITEAGMKGSVTVATNMAGRGVDIILGGNKKEKWEFDNPKDYDLHVAVWQSQHDAVLERGGLHVIGSERHESRRIDNQLRGRSGRQGDPGMSRFYVALDDDIMRLFGGDQVAKLMTFFKLPEDVPLEHGMVTRSIEQAQTKVEGFHFDSRKNLVEYDDVLNKQREIIYGRRRKMLLGEDEKDMIMRYVDDHIRDNVSIHTDTNGSIDREKILAEFTSMIPFDPHSLDQLQKQLLQKQTVEESTEFLITLAHDLYDSREKAIGGDMMRQIERWVALTVIDNLWMDHLTAIEDLREGIGLRGYGQRDPLVEYKNEAFTMFERLVNGIEADIVDRIYKVKIQLSPEQMKAIQTASKIAELTKKSQTNEGIKPSSLGLDTKGTDAMANASKKSQGNDQPIVKKQLGRNDPCWCGSGKKWKKCHYPELG